MKCLQCEKKLKKQGYNKNGKFCTLRCGYKYGLQRTNNHIQADYIRCLVTNVNYNLDQDNKYTHNYLDKTPLVIAGFQEQELTLNITILQSEYTRIWKMFSTVAKESEIRLAFTNYAPSN